MQIHADSSDDVAISKLKTQLEASKLAVARYERHVRQQIAMKPFIAEYKVRMKPEEHCIVMFDYVVSPISPLFSRSGCGGRVILLLSSRHLPITHDSGFLRHGWAEILVPDYDLDIQSRRRGHGRQQGEPFVFRKRYAYVLKVPSFDCCRICHGPKDCALYRGAHDKGKDIYTVV